MSKVHDALSIYNSLPDDHPSLPDSFFTLIDLMVLELFTKKLEWHTKENQELIELLLDCCIAAKTLILQYEDKLFDPDATFETATNDSEFKYNTGSCDVGQIEPAGKMFIPELMLHIKESIKGNRFFDPLKSNRFAPVALNYVVGN